MDPIGMDDPIPMFSYDLLYLSEFPQVVMWFGGLDGVLIGYGTSTLNLTGPRKLAIPEGNIIFQP